jgi:hypothetical protein
LGVLYYTQTGKAEVLNEKIYLAPFLNENNFDNPLKQNFRTYPVDMIYPKKRKFNSTITIPEGYKVDYLPNAMKINNQLFELNYLVNSNAGKLLISFDYYFKKAVYQPIDYERVKYFFDEVIKKGNEKIVLSKM